MKIKSETILACLACAAFTAILACSMAHDQHAKDQHNKTPKSKHENIDSTKIETKRDTVFVLDYKPRSKYCKSQTYTTNKSGQEYKIEKHHNIPVERGDEIVIDIKKTTTPEGQSWTNYELVKNLTTEKLKLKYINKR